jgi:hypothetical protein
MSTAQRPLRFSSPAVSGRTGAPITPRSRFTSTKSPAAAPGTLIRSSS